MPLWIWLGLGFAVGLLALAAFNYIYRPAVSGPAPTAEDLGPAELVRAQLKLAILQDRLEQSASEFERERADQERAAQLRLAATEAAYQRQMLAMQPRLNAIAAETPVQINIRVEAPTAVVDADPPTAVTTLVSPDVETVHEAPADEDLQSLVEGAAPTEDQPNESQGKIDEPQVPAEEPPTSVLLLAEAVDSPAKQPVLAIEERSVENEQASAEVGVVEVGAAALEIPPQASGGDIQSVVAGEDATRSGPQTAAFPVPIGIELQDIEYVELPVNEIDTFLAVAKGDIEDPFDGIEPQQSLPPAQEAPPLLPDAPLDDLDELEPYAITAGSDAAPSTSFVSPWHDELDADFVDDEEVDAAQQAKVLAVSTTLKGNGTHQQAATSRWEVLPREESDMANLDYLDSGVFAVPTLPGWRREETAVASRDTEEMSFGATSTLTLEDDPQEGDAIMPETAIKPPEELPDPEDDLSWLAQYDESNVHEPLPALEEDAAIEATVAQILGKAPQSAVASAAPQTVEEMERATVAAILARAAMAEAVDMKDENQIIGRAVQETAVPKPPFVWERRAIAWDASYFDNIKLNGEPVLVRKDREIDFDWGPQAPAAGVPAGQFGVRWNGVLILDPGLYRFTLAAPDGIRLWLNERLVLSAWYDQSSQEYAREFNWQGGSLYVRCEHYEHGPDAHIHFNWERIA